MMGGIRGFLFGRRPSLPDARLTTAPPPGQDCARATNTAGGTTTGGALWLTGPPKTGPGSVLVFGLAHEPITLMIDPPGSGKTVYIG